jgi:Family of unknown function (DUF5996)
MRDAWPDLATAGWLETATTMHMWSQIVGKTRLALEPMTSHWWQVPLYVTATGIATPVLHDGDRGFEVELDLVGHALRIRDDAGRTPSFALEPMTVADFLARYREALASIGVELRILARPTEVDPAIPFDRDDVHRSYDPAWATAFATALRRADAILKEFRGGFLGKVSPVHFFWGGFDLAVTRFSGRTAPPHPGGVPNCADWVMREAYSHEVSSAGFWPGNAQFPHAAFYAYAYPEPDGFARSPVRPEAARYDTTVREFILPYDAVRRSSDPRRDVLDFLATTYAAAADLARWDRASLER